MQIFESMGRYFSELGTIGLALNAFIESFFLVPPPDFLLIAMDLAQPKKALYYASIATIASAVGGYVGYLIGKFGGRPAFNWIIGMFSKDKEKAHSQFEKIEKMYGEYGALAVFLAAFTPIPYKVFTIASGILNMNPVTFFFVSVVGRGMRFFIVSIVLMLFGESIKNNIEWVIIAVSLIVVAFFVILYKKRHKFVK